MKSRIVRELHRMANRKDEKYIRDMAEATGMCENDLPTIAEKVLKYLLHDYSHFSVVTIDSFFQKVIRSFAREMGLYAGYNVELDQDSVLDESTGLMLDDIDKNDFLKDWLVGWAKRKIEEGKSWNFKSDVLRLGSEIFSEELQNIEPEMLRETTDKESLERYRMKLQQLVDSYWDYLQGYGQMAISIMESYGLEVDHFTRKSSGVGGYFDKLSKRQEAKINTYVMLALKGIEGWHGKYSHWKTPIRNAYESGLGEMLQNTVTYQTEHAREVATAAVILKQINVLGVLCDLMRYVNEYTRDQNLFLLSEASGFLKTIIANADAPFIYERVGSFYNHFMIDEFQDTSSIQWDNFRPLIANSIASGYREWIVGDVKQSIYRWRNTDWKILSEQVERDLSSQYVKVQNLDMNWRSAPEVVHFNNAFFREAVLQLCGAFLIDEEKTADEEYLHGLAASMTEAYKDSYQHLPERQKEEKGYVHLSAIAEEKDAGKTWRDKALEELTRRIEQLQDMGYGLSDIAILVRENKEAQTIADMLLAYRQANPDSKYRYDVLSNESLLIGNSPAVKWLVSAMRYIVEPNDLINRAYLQHEYETYLSPQLPSHRGGSVESPSGSPLDSTSLFSCGEGTEDSSLPVYELSDKLIHQYNLYQNAGQAPFLQAFQDILLQYTRREATDIRSFLDWWEGEKNRKYVTIPDNQDAIRLITIHKSKGLEFDAVIIPFCDWPLCKAGKTLWCQPAGEPFNDMKLLPLKFEPALRNTVFVKEYLREKMLSYIDNLNLLYVAFTRARKALFIAIPQQEKNEFTGIKDLIHRIYHQPLSDSTDSLPSWRRGEKGVVYFELGILTGKETKKEEKIAEQASYLSRSAPRTWDFVPHITRNSAYFVSDVIHGAQMNKGRLLHDIFRSIVTTADLEHSLNTMITEGKLSEAERTHIINRVHQALVNPTVRRWFAPGLQVKTEAEILLPDGSIARPDRIVFERGHIQVIDYKFGEVESGKYRNQVLRYMEHLRKMGYASVKGFLWYVTLNKVEEVREREVSLKDLFGS
jgi:ATP-dependent exoDNAse (exonuclease V) beta subunit